MNRLHKLTDKQINEWYQARVEVGKEQYADDHLQRYNLVDIMEEIMDAHRILKLFQNRMLKECNYTADIDGMIDVIKLELKTIEDDLKFLDSFVADEACSDEKGGERVWWNE